MSKRVKRSPAIRRPTVADRLPNRSMKRRPSNLLTKTQASDSAAKSKIEQLKKIVRHQTGQIQELQKTLALERHETKADRRTLLTADAEFRNSQQHYADLFDFAPVGYVILDRAGKIQTLNLTAARMFDRDRASLIGYPMRRLVDRADYKNFHRHIALANSSSEKEITSELWFRRKNGRRILLQLSSIGSRGLNQSPCLVRTAITDVTEIRQIEHALAANERRFRALIQNASETITLLAPDGTIVYESSNVRSVLGYDASEMEGRSGFDFVHRDDLPLARRVFAALLAEPGSTRKTELRIRRKSGRWAIMDIVARNLINDEAVKAIVLNSRDISRRKETEEELRRARDKLEMRIEERTAQLTEANAALLAIMDNSPSLIFLKDLEGRYLHVNRQFEQVFHKPLKEFLGKTDANLFPPEQAAVFRANDLKVIESRQPMQFDETTTFDDGQHISIVTKFPLFDSDGDLFAVGGIVTDITERKRLEEEVLQIGERERRRIAQDLHDGLGQQMAGLWYLSDSLKKRLQAKRSSEVESAEKIARLMDVTLSQLRSLARGLHPVPTEPSGLMSALEELATNITDIFKVQCRFCCAQTVLIEDNSIATHLYRLAQEAVTNSIKHGRAEKIEIELSSAPQRITLAVRNDGKGVGEHTQSGQSKGLGLRIMYYRAEMIGASLAIRKKARGGTEIICTVHKEAATSRSNDHGQTNL